MSDCAHCSRALVEMRDRRVPARLWLPLLGWHALWSVAWALRLVRGRPGGWLYARAHALRREVSWRLQPGRPARIEFDGILRVDRETGEATFTAAEAAESR